MRGWIVVFLTVILCIPAAAQTRAKRDPATMLAELERARGEIASLEERVAGAEGDERRVLERRLSRLRIQKLTDLHALIDRLDTRSDPTVRARVVVLATQVADNLAGVIERTGARLDSMRNTRGRDEGANPELDASIAEDQTLLDAAYAALEAHLDKMERLGVDVFERRVALVSGLRDRAAYLADRLELQVERRKALEAESRPGDASSRAAIKAAQARINGLAKSLTGTLDLLDDLGVSTSALRQRQILATRQLTTDILDTDVAAGLLRSWLSEARDGLLRNLPGWLFQAAIFLAVLLVFRVLSLVARRLVARGLDASSVEITHLMRAMIVSVVSKGVMLLGLLVALSQLGLSIGPLLAGLGVAGFIVGFALQDTLSNFASGMMILIYRPFDVADVVEAGGVTGRVEAMSLVTTTILTFDNQTLVVPNSKIWGDVIKNVTAQARRRVDLTFGVSYGDDIEKTEGILREIVAAHPKVLAEPEPNIRLHQLGDSSVNFIVRPWASTEDYWDVYWDLMREVKLRFDREGITIPFPQRDVHVFPADPVERTEATADDTDDQRPGTS